MNLVQIQERLKDLPTQAVMSYANGQNPQVPPYLALGELNRRKQMEQQAAQPPKGTVKDSIEQQVGLMQLQKLRQGQMAQQSAMQGSQAPTIPQGTPEPAMQPEEEMAMAAGGLTSLPMREMNFGSGGIIAFANKEGKQLVEDDEDRAMKDLQTEIEYRERAERQNRLEADRAKSMAAVANQSFTNPGMQNDPRLVGKTPPAETLGTLPSPAKNVPPGGIVNVPPRVMQQNAAPPAPAAAPAAPVPSAAQKFQEGILAGTGLQALPPEYAPPKQAPIGEDYLKYMGDREQKRREDAMKFENVEKDRARRDLWNSLIAAGEATRGQKGIGALFTGAGRSLGESLTAAEERESAFRQKQQDLADNDAKTRFEIANLRRAEERGDSKAIYESKVKLVELSNQRAQMQSTTANQIAQNESSERVARANNLTQLEVARINQVTAGLPDATERIAAKYAEIKRTKGEAAAEEYMKTIERTKFGNRGEAAADKLNIQRQALAEKLPVYQMAMSSYVNEKDPAKKAAALAKVREIEALHGIKSSEAPTIDTSQWGNPKVK
jgi:hypothetical protein